MGFRAGSNILAPIPIRNPTIGTGLALGGGRLFTLAPGAGPSFLGAGGFYTNGGSFGYALGGRLDFGRWQVQAAVGQADLDYDLYVLDLPVPIEQTGDIVQLGAAYSLTDSLSVGLDLGYLQSEIGSGLHLLPDDLVPDFGIGAATATVALTYDTRDDTIFPTSGDYAELRLGGGRVYDAFERDFTRAGATLAAYRSVPGGVLAGQASLCAVDEPTPFFLSCSLGGSDSFRGYDSTRHLGERLVSAQVEYRGHLAGRFGYVVFGGLGRVADSFDELPESDLLAAGGAGLRFRVSRAFPVEFSVDVAVNADSETTTYFYVGQRF